VSTSRVPCEKPREPRGGFCTDNSRATKTKKVAKNRFIFQTRKTSPAPRSGTKDSGDSSTQTVSGKLGGGAAEFGLGPNTGKKQEIPRHGLSRRRASKDSSACCEGPPQKKQGKNREMINKMTGQELNKRAKWTERSRQK